MRLAAEKRRPYLRPQDVLVGGERQKSLAEYLEFVQPGDIQLLEQCVKTSGMLYRYGPFNALAALHMVFEDTGLSRTVRETSTKYIEMHRWEFEQIIQAGVQGVHGDGDATKTLLGLAPKLLPLRDILKEPLNQPTDELWGQVAIIAEREAVKQGPIFPYAALLAVDPERFSAVDGEALQVACLQAIDQQRMKRSIKKDPTQMDLLKMLALTRLMFPDLIGPASLRDEEREAIYAGLAKSRDAVRQFTNFDVFPAAFYHLALVQAPHMTVDATGIHLSIQENSGQHLHPLPGRSEF